MELIYERETYVIQVKISVQKCDDELAKSKALLFVANHVNSVGYEAFPIITVLGVQIKKQE